MVIFRIAGIQDMVISSLRLYEIWLYRACGYTRYGYVAFVVTRDMVILPLRLYDILLYCGCGYTRYGYIGSVLVNDMQNPPLPTSHEGPFSFFVQSNAQCSEANEK